MAASDSDVMAGMNHGVPPAPDEGEPYVLQFFSAAEFATVEILTEMIIPVDDKPGAKAARVGR